MSSKRAKQVILGVFLLITAAAIIYLTFQAPTETIGLSSTVREWLTSKGCKMTMHQVRSNAHLVEYFALGLMLAAFFRHIEKDLKPVLLIGFLFGTADECLRIIIPTREFDLYDLIRDYIGVVSGTLIFFLVSCLFSKVRSLLKKGEEKENNVADLSEN